MATQSPTLMRCERCRAVISIAEATELLLEGASCGACGGTLTLCGGPRRPRSGAEGEPRPSAERRLLGVLREADGRPMGPRALAEAGIYDPANALYQLERAGHRIERAYADVTTGQPRFLGYHLRGGAGPQASGSQPSRSP